MTIDEAINEIILGAKDFQIDALGALYKNFLKFLDDNKAEMDGKKIIEARIKFKVTLNSCSQMTFNRIDNEKR